LHLAHIEIPERSRHGAIVADAIIARQIGEVHIVDQGAKPRREVERHPCTRDGERIFRRVPILGIDIWVGSRTGISQSTATGIRRNGLRDDGIVDGVEEIFLVLRLRLEGDG